MRSLGEEREKKGGNRRRRIKLALLLFLLISAPHSNMYCSRRFFSDFLFRGLRSFAEEDEEKNLDFFLLGFPLNWLDLLSRAAQLRGVRSVGFQIKVEERTIVM